MKLLHSVAVVLVMILPSHAGAIDFKRTLLVPTLAETPAPLISLYTNIYLSRGMLSLNDNGEVAFFSEIGIPLGIEPGMPVPRSGIFVASETSSRIVALEYGQPPGAAGDTYSADSFRTGSLSHNSQGAVAFRAGLNDDPTRQGIFVVAADGTGRVVALTGDPAPGTGGKSYTSFGGAPAINDLGEVAFTAGLDGGEHQGIFVESQGADRLVALEGEAAPDTGGGTFVSPGLRPVQINDASDVVFHSDVQGGTTAAGIFVSSGTGSRAVARAGDVVPGRADWRYLQSVDPDGSPFTSQCINDAGIVSFTTYATPSTGSINALFLDSDGVVSELAFIWQYPDWLPEAYSGRVYSASLNDRGDAVFDGSWRFDPDTWEPGTPPVENEVFFYDALSGRIFPLLKYGDLPPFSADNDLEWAYTPFSLNNHGQFAFYGEGLPDPAAEENGIYLMTPLPSLVCPATFEIASSGSEGVSSSYVAPDRVGVVPRYHLDPEPVITHDAPDTLPRGSTTVVYTLTDSAGTDTCEVEVHVVLRKPVRPPWKKIRCVRRPFGKRPGGPGKGIRSRACKRRPPVGCKKCSLSGKAHAGKSAFQRDAILAEWPVVERKFEEGRMARDALARMAAHFREVPAGPVFTAARKQVALETLEEERFESDASRDKLTEIVTASLNAAAPVFRAD
jgi:hypothetical protein